MLQRCLFSSIISLAVQFCPEFFSARKFDEVSYNKKAAMISSSLPQKSVPYRNRTYNRVLGGPRYIHLTKGTNYLCDVIARHRNMITHNLHFVKTLKLVRKRKLIAVVTIMVGILSMLCIQNRQNPTMLTEAARSVLAHAL